MTKQEIIEFLKSQEKELRSNNLSSVYMHTSSKNAPYLTKFFLDKNIDPLKYLTFVPPQYAYNLKEYYNNEIILPKNIEAVDLWAFGDTFATKLYIPSSVYYIREGAFSSANLKEVYIDGCPGIHRKAFFDCFRLKDIKINCTKEEWYKKNPVRSPNRKDWPFVFEDADSNAKITFLK